MAVLLEVSIDIKENVETCIKVVGLSANIIESTLY